MAIWQVLNNPVDIYCERLDASFWSEPLNALSNAAFPLVALLIWRVMRARGPISGMNTVLTGLCALIGLGSFLFHTFANRWSEWADTVPIWSFVGLYVYAALTTERGTSRRYKVIAAILISSVTLTVLFLMATGETTDANAADPLNGTGQYAPALIALLIFAAASWRLRLPQAPWVLAAAVTFLASMAFRTFDMALCTSWPTGTHFMWHILNAAMIGFLLMARDIARPAVRPATSAR